MKKIILLTTLFLTLILTANAQEIPIKIKPAQNISTSRNQVEVSDRIKFTTVNDIYKDDKLFIPKGSTVTGIVDYVSDNGWAADNAQVNIKQFKIKDINNKLLLIDDDVTIDGFEILKYKGNRIAQFFNYCGVAFRGKEIEIIAEEDNIKFNIWLKE